MFDTIQRNNSLSQDWSILLQQEGIRPVKNGVVGCWRGYLSGVRCRLARSPADATATHCLFFSKIHIGFTFLVPAHLGSPIRHSLSVFQ